MKTVLILCCFVASSLAASSTPWSYDYSAADGPANWGNLAGYAVCGNGRRQTPVDIVRTASTYMNFPALQWATSGSLTSDWTVTNNGHSVAATPSTVITLTGGPLGTKSYNVFNIHIHFGNSTFRASEHAFNGVRTTGEFHIVTYNNAYNNLSTAAGSGDADALAVFGVLFDVGTGTADAGITSLIDIGSNLTNKGDSVVSSLDFSTMYATADLSSIYTYDGSLTTPACNEIVRWLVVSRTHTVSAASINSLMSLTSGEASSPGIPLYGNTRPLQSLNGRTIMRNFDSSAIAVSFSLYTMLAAVALAFIASR